MSKKTGGDATKQVAVDTVAKLLRKLGSQHSIGTVYEYTYQDKVVVTVDSTKSGKLFVTVAPSAWAIKVTEYFWQYEVDMDATIDPTMADPTVDGWTGVILTDVPEVDDSTEEDAEDTAEEDIQAEEDTEA